MLHNSIMHLSFLVIIFFFLAIRECTEANKGTFYNNRGHSSLSNNYYDPDPFEIGELSSAADTSSNYIPSFSFVPGQLMDNKAKWEERYIHPDCNVTFTSSNETANGSSYINVHFEVSENISGSECFVIEGSTYDISVVWPDPNITVTELVPVPVGVVLFDIFCFDIVCYQQRASCFGLEDVLDNSYADPFYPLVFLATDRNEIKATMHQTSTCGTPSYNWRIIGVEQDDMNFFRVNTNTAEDVLILYENTLSAGMYIVILEVQTTAPIASHFEDFIYVQIVLPDLRAVVNSASLEELPENADFYLTAFQSSDPAHQVPGVSDLRTDAYWHVLVSETLTENEVLACIATFPNCSILTTGQINGSLTAMNVSYRGAALRMNENTFDPAVVWVFVIFRMTHDKRSSSALTVYHRNAIASRHFLYRCVYNCLSAVVGKSPSGMAGFEVTPNFNEYQYSVQYTRTLQEWDGTAFVNSSIGLVGGQLSDYLSLTDGPLVSGNTYLLSLDILLTPLPSVHGLTNWTISLDVLKHINYPPYNGYCYIDKTEGNASLTSYQVTCLSWMDEEERYERDALLDYNPSLTYVVVQKNIEGDTDNETLVVSSDTTMLFVAMTGDPVLGYQSVLVVHIMDMFNEAATTEFTITSYPMFDATTVSGDAIGEEIVRNFSSHINQTFYNFEPDLDMSIPVGKAAAQILNSIPPPQYETDLPVTLDGTPGVLMDLNINSGATREQLSFNEYISNLLNTTLDPATVAIRESIELITNRINYVMNRRVLSGHKYLDQNYLDQMTQCFTALISRQTYVTDTAKVIAENALAVLASASGSIWTTSQAQSENQQITSKSQLVDMTGNIVGVVVPDNLNQARVVYDLAYALDQIDDMVLLSGPNMTKAVEEASVSPTERAYLYLKSQQQLQAELSLSKNLARSTTQSIQNMTKDILQSTDLCTGCSQVLGSGSMIQNVSILPMDSIENVTVSAKDVKLNMNLGKPSTGESMAVAVTHFDKNIFMYDSDLSSSFVSYGVMHVELGTTAGVSLDQVSYEQNVDHVDKELVIPFIAEEDVSKFSLHKFMYRSSSDEVCLNLEPVTVSILRFDGYLRFKEAPTIRDYDVKFSVSGDTNWVMCLGSALMQGHQGMTYLGVQTVEGTTVSRKKRDTHYVIDLDMQQSIDDSSPPKTSTSAAYRKYALSRRKRAVNGTSSANVTVTSQHPPYYMSVVTASCLNWEESQRAWKSDKCQMSWVPAANKVQCVCQNVPQMTFGTSFFVAPQSIDFSSAFLRFSPKSQAAIIGTLAVVGIIYALLLVWARRADKEDMLKWGILPLADNYDEDTHCYLVSVHTGLRLGAGTSSMVAFVLSGHRTDTGIREMRDGYRKDFPTGSVLQYLMTSQFHLGQLTHLRIWHDNSGPGNMASWYLSRVTVFDMKKKDTYNFLCERWISVEYCDGDVMECTLPATNPENEAFDYTFMTHAKRTLSDDHAWISFMYRPNYSNFTRAQRVTCAILFVMVNMVVNAMYYNPGEEYETKTFLVLGPCRMSLKQLSISILTALITTPSTFLIVFIFKLSRRSTMRITSKEQEKQYRPESQASTASTTSSEKKVTFSTRLFGNSKADEDTDEPPVMYIEEQNRKCMLPSKFAYLGWFLSLGGMVTSAFFVLVYSMQWGEQKSGEWLATFLLSLLQSILLIDPLKVGVFALFLAMVKKTLETSNYGNIDTQTVEGLAKTTDSQSDELPRQQMTPTELKVAKEKSKVATRWNRIVLDIVFNIFFMWLLLSVSYSNTNEESFHLHTAIVNSMSINATGDNEYKDISTTEAYYKWLRSIAVPQLFPETYTNGEVMHWTGREYIDGLTSLRLGPPRLRQFRIRKDDCHLPKVDTQDCYRGYTLSREEDGDYCIGWGLPPCPSTDLSVNYTSASWQYTDLDITDSLPVLGRLASYSGDGYFMTMDVNRNLSMDFVDELYNNIWLDRNTRAVALEFTVYCANVNLFAYSLFLVEFPPSGGAFSMYAVYPARVYQHIGALGDYIFFCELAGLLFMVLLALQLVYALFSYKCKALRKFWFLLDFLRLCILITTIVLYLIRYRITQSAIEKFQENRRAFVDFYQVTLWNQLVIYMLGISVFLSTLRVLKILEGNKNVYIIASVFSKMASDLFWFSVLFFYFISVFAMLGFLLFGSRLHSYMSMYTSLRTLFVTIMGKNRFTEMNQSDPILAKAYFFCFVCIISLMMFSIILSSLTQCIHRISQEYNQRLHKEDAFTYGFNKIASTILRQNPDKLDQNRVYPFRDINRRRDTLDTQSASLD